MFRGLFGIGKTISAKILNPWIHKPPAVLQRFGGIVQGLIFHVIYQFCLLHHPIAVITALFVAGVTVLVIAAAAVRVLIVARVDDNWRICFGDQQYSTCFRHRLNSPGDVP